MKQTETARQIKRDTAIKSMRKIVSLPSGSPERWRETFIHFLYQRPEARPEADFIASEVAKRRKMMDKYASSKHGRAVMSQPSFLMGILRATDPEYFTNITAVELAGERHLRKMKKAFPQYFYAEVI